MVEAYWAVIAARAGAGGVEVVAPTVASSAAAATEVAATRVQLQELVAEAETQANAAPGSKVEAQVVPPL